MRMMEMDEIEVENEALTDLDLIMLRTWVKAFLPEPIRSPQDSSSSLLLGIKSLQQKNIIMRRVGNVSPAMFLLTSKGEAIMKMLG